MKLSRLLRYVRYVWELDRALDADDQCLVRGILAAIQDGGNVGPIHETRGTGRKRDNGKVEEFECLVCGERWWESNFNETLIQTYSAALQQVGDL
jgi:hypothetical protein